LLGQALAGSAGLELKTAVFSVTQVVVVVARRPSSKVRFEEGLPRVSFLDLLSRLLF
jgi:hypothetical protein